MDELHSKLFHLELGDTSGPFHSVILTSIRFRMDGTLCDQEQFWEHLSPVAIPPNFYQTHTRRLTASLQKEVINLVVFSSLRPLSPGSESRSGPTWEITPSLSPKKVMLQNPQSSFYLKCCYHKIPDYEMKILGSHSNFTHPPFLKYIDT